MSLIGARYFISRGTVENWLEVNQLDPNANKKESARKVRTLITRLADVGLVAIQKTVCEDLLSDSMIIQSGPQFQALKMALLSLPLLQLDASPGDGWAVLPDDLARAAEFIGMAPTGNTTWISQATGLGEIGAEMGELCGLSEYLDIYDRYLIQNLATANASSESWMETFRFIMQSVSNRKNDEAPLTITLRGCVPAQQMRNAKEEILEWIDVSRHELRPAAVSALRSRVSRCAEGIAIKPRVVLDVREELGQNRRGQVDAGEWFHGRFLHVPGVAVISSDRSMDFVAQQPRGSVGGVIYGADGSSRAIRDNGFVRWPQSQFSEANLQSRWSGLVPLQKGGPIEILS